MSESSLPLFYTNPTPLDARTHAALGLVWNFGLHFTHDVNAIPINLIEFPQICHEYPIAFTSDGNATPVALLGVRNNENLFVDEEGEWRRDTYIPAYIRRYPFIFSEMPDGEQLSLCVDLAPGIVEENGEQPFFERDGKPSQLSLNALEFCKSYHAAAQQTLDFSRALSDLDLLVERSAEIAIEGAKINFAGFSIIDEDKLREVDVAVLLDLHGRGFVPFIYAHLFSGSRWQTLTKLLRERISVEHFEDFVPFTATRYASSVRPLRFSFMDAKDLG